MSGLSIRNSPNKYHIYRIIYMLVYLAGVKKEKKEGIG
jgi:hypothetical protein